MSVGSYTIFRFALGMILKSRAFYDRKNCAWSKTWNSFIGGNTLVVLGLVQSWFIANRAFMGVRTTTTVLCLKCSPLFHLAIPVWLLWLNSASYGAGYWWPFFFSSRQCCLEFDTEYFRHVLWVNNHVLDGSLWMNVIMIVHTSGGDVGLCLRTSLIGYLVLVCVTATSAETRGNSWSRTGTVH